MGPVSCCPIARQVLVATQVTTVAVTLDATTHASAFVIDAVAQFDWELSKRSDHPDATSVGGAAEGAAPPPFGPSAKYQ